ncbi:MAG: arginine--tRNA ligase, partial [Candidatus Omnitrophota bacterium]
EALNKQAQKSALKGYIEEIRAEGPGFINFYLNNAYHYGKLREILNRGREALRANLGREKRVLVEFVSANPTGSLSVAHARQAAVGDSLANILAFLGFAVKREYYLNDVGNQINILAKSVALRMQELSGEKIEFPENHYQGEYIYEIAKEAAKQKIEPHALGDFAANYILDIIRKELDDFGVKFDCWYSQKELEKSGKIQKAFDFLKKKGFLYESDGALWFKSTSFGDDKDRVVIKSDGAYTYLAPDIAYHDDKYKRGFEWLINLWGPDHHGYIGRLKASVAAFGRDPDSLSIVIVQLATIFRNAKPVQMSTRRGEYITLREVLDEVGKDAARFFFLMRRTNSHLDFDLEVAKKQTSENPVYYVQYAHARISSILRNAGVQLGKEADLALLKEKEELGLVKKILQFSYIMNICLKTQDPYMLTVYLQEISEAFHKFYDLHRVLGDDLGLTQARLSLIEGARIVISTGLELLGVSRPEKM